MWISLCVNRCVERGKGTVRGCVDRMLLGYVNKVMRGCDDREGYVVTSCCVFLRIISYRVLLIRVMRGCADRGVLRV